MTKLSPVESLPETDYDECGNPICNDSVEPVPELIVEYAYDALNRLIRENNYALGKTYTYTYDTAGNILGKSTYDVTSGAVVTPTDVKEYTYSVSGWKDRLVAYGGQGISYDMVGNPWNYRGHNLEWSRIRLLTKWDDIEIEYNASGIRTRKGDTYYELDGDTIISETTNGNTIRYYYGNGGIVGFRHNGTRYYYEKNLQGDIIGIYDASGDKVGAYVYDAWGNCTITTNVGGIANVNPFRYREYYFDADIGLYYLKNRYYDPQVGRFINADECISTNTGMCGYNMFAYCNGDPVNLVDIAGMYPVSTMERSNGFDDTTLEVYSMVIPLDHGWFYRIDNPNTPTEHIHVYNKDKNKGWYAQNKDGSPHDKGKNGPGDGPPKKVREKLKKKSGWDWNNKNGNNSDESKDNGETGKSDNSVNYIWGAVAAGGTAYIIYRTVRFIPSLVPALWWSLPANAVTP